MGYRWFTEHKSNIRKVFLILFIISLISPWGFDRHSVPADIPCDFRLYGDFCGTPIRSIVAFSMGVPVLIQSISDLISGTLFYYVRLVNGLWLLTLIPILTTMYSLWIKETSFIRTMNLITWILALISTLTAFIFTMLTITGQAIWLWGLWLYIVMALNAVIFEFVIIKNNPIKND
ncbi:MAG: hypothetical protein R3307_01210 [Anaerolineales bacterium]|nr:hypothetical protein [Anaerolineales bacterium]